MTDLLNKKSEYQNNEQQSSSTQGSDQNALRPGQTYLHQAYQIYVIPQPPSYQVNPNQQQLVYTRNENLQMTSQTNLPIQEYSAQFEQANQHVMSPRELNRNEYGQLSQTTTHSNRNPQLQSEQQPYYYSGPQRGFEANYGAGSTPPPSYQYAGHYPVPPPPPPPRSATDAPMIRQNSFRRQQEQPEPAGWTGFTDNIIRARFIRKVYIILTLQLLFTLGIIALFIYEPHVKKFVQENLYLYWVSLAIFFSVYIGLACFQSMRRKFPGNIIALIIFTMAMSYMCATISTLYKTDSVLMAVGICAAVCFTVSVFSFYTKYDFTSCGGILCILLLILFLFGIIAMFFPTMVMRMLYAAFGAIVFTIMLAYDTQMMMGGKNYELSPEEYVFAAIQVYIDIVYIFLFLLMLLGGRES